MAAAREMNGSIEITRLASFAEIGREAWNDLVARSATDSIFQTYEWHNAWWAAHGAGRELVLLRASDNGALAGIAALVLHDGVLSFAGEGDYADLICADEDSNARTALLDAALEMRGLWRMMTLANVPAKSPTATALAGVARSARVHRMPCPRLVIAGRPGSLDAVQKKKSLRRHHNYFRKLPGYSVEHLTRAHEIEPELERFFDQHVGRWAVTSFPSLFLKEQNRNFYRALTRALDSTGWLRFTRLTVNREAVAFHFGFVYKGVFVWYKPSFEPSLARRSPGEALLKELFGLAAREQLGAFDFTIGAEAFKFRFTNDCRETQTWMVFRDPADYWVKRAKLAVRRWLPAKAERGVPALV